MKLVREIVSWAMSSSIDPLGTDEVPGANDTERVALAALGGLAAALAGERVQTWPDPLRKWADAPPPPPTLVAATQRELRGGIDILATLYESLVTGRSRRRLGTFFTPPAVVEFMLDLAESHLGRPSVVIDPGAGVGAFSVAATRRWPDASVLAVDVNVVTLGLLAARDDGSIDLIPEDFLRWSASGAVPREGPRLWIGNPPYTRHQELDKDAKSIAIRAAGDLVESRRAGLSAYFLAATLQARAAGDVICYLLPGSWLDTSYGEPLRQGLLASSAGALEMYGFRTDIDLFPGTRVAAMALLVGPDQEARTFSTASARITAGAVTVSRAAHHSREAVHERFGHWVWPRPTGGRQGRVPLGTYANVRRGIATGANRFFFLTKAQRDKLPAAVTRRGILRLRRVIGDSLTADGHRSLSEQGERTWLLMLDDPSVMGDETIAAWMREAKKAEIPARYLPRHRDPWYRVESIEPPDILVSPMSNARLRVVRNVAGAVPSNAIYGLYLNGSKELAAPLTAWLNSEKGQDALKAQARTYGRGLVKLEPSDLAAVLVPTAEDLASGSGQ